MSTTLLAADRRPSSDRRRWHQLGGRLVPCLLRAGGTDFIQHTPETVVFFTDGEPTYERLAHRAAGGGDIPTQPAPVGNWPQYSGGAYSNGSDYSQVAFDRANWVVNSVRGSTTGSSAWASATGSRTANRPSSSRRVAVGTGSTSVVPASYQRATWGYEKVTRLAQHGQLPEGLAVRRPHRLREQPRLRVPHQQLGQLAGRDAGPVLRGERHQPAPRRLDQPSVGERAA